MRLVVDEQQAGAGPGRRCVHASGIGTSRGVLEHAAGAYPPRVPDSSPANPADVPAGIGSAASAPPLPLPVAARSARRSGEGRDSVDLAPRQLSLTDFLDVETLQAVQDGFASITRLQTQILDAQGRPVTRPTDARVRSAADAATGLLLEEDETGRFVAPINVAPSSSARSSSRPPAGPPTPGSAATSSSGSPEACASTTPSGGRSTTPPSRPSPPTAAPPCSSSS